MFQILDKENLLKNKKFKVKIKKLIPQEAGLGGGSMNAANVFNYLIKKNFVLQDTFKFPFTTWEDRFYLNKRFQ